MVPAQAQDSRSQRGDGIRHAETWLVVLCLLGLAQRLWLAWQDMATLVGKVVADDFFYYLTIARNLVAGRGPTFDGMALTNGFHPLYTLALTPLLALAGEDRELGVHLALSLVSILDVLVAAVLYALVARRVGRNAGIVATLSWLANPWAMTTALNGVESAIYLLMVVLTLAVYVRLARHVWSGHRAAVLVGVLGGLAALGRTDGIFLMAAIGADGLWRAWRGRAAWPAVGRALLLMALGFVVTTGPWWLWNLANFGSIMQVSGQALLWQWHGVDWLRPGNYLAGTLTALRRFGLRLGVFLVQMWPLLAVAVVSAIARPAMSGSLSQRGEGWGEGRMESEDTPSPYPSPLQGEGTVHRAPAESDSLSQRGEGRGEGRRPGSDTSPQHQSPLQGEGTILGDMLVPFVYVAGLAVWYVFYFWHMQNWYVMPLLLVGSLLTGYLYPALALLARSLPLGGVRLMGGYFALSFVAILVVVWLTRGFGYPHQVQGLRIAEWVNAHTQTGETVGVWNAGVVGYFSRRQVVNLDGVTNNDLYRWVSERGLALSPATVVPYAAERGITYITDYEDILAPVLGSPAGLLLVEAYRLPDTYVVIYRLREREKGT